MLSPNPQSTLQRYRALLNAFPVVDLTDPTMERFARIRAQLRQAGNLLPDLDLLIAATAVQSGLTLITRNLGHFQRIRDLALYQPG